MANFLFVMGSFCWLITLLFAGESAASTNNAFAGASMGAFFVGVAFMAVGFGKDAR
jgi:hypothetical protein